jgi:hypothetical protein
VAEWSRENLNPLRDREVTILTRLYGKKSLQVMSKKLIVKIAEGWVDEKLFVMQEDIAEYTFPDRFERIDYGVVDEVFTEVVRILHKQQVKK